MCDTPPAVGDDGGQLVFEGAKLECIMPSPGAGMVGFGGDQVAACHQVRGLGWRRSCVIGESLIGILR